MTECDAIIEANNEIEKLKKENQRLNALCVQYGFEMGGLAEENEELKTKVDFYKDFQKDARELEKENEQLKREKMLLASFIRRNHDITMISRILNK